MITGRQDIIIRACQVFIHGFIEKIKQDSVLDIQHIKNIKVHSKSTSDYKKPSLEIKRDGIYGTIEDINGRMVTSWVDWIQKYTGNIDLQTIVAKCQIELMDEIKQLSLKGNKK